jgi:hypothetical protein
MNTHPPHRWRLLGAAALAWAACTSAQAGIVVYTNAGAFAAASPVSGTDSFDSLPAGTSTGPLARSAGLFSYSVNAVPNPDLYNTGGWTPPGVLYAAGNSPDRWLSTNTADDTLVFFNLNGAGGIGGLFFGSDIDGQFLAGTMLRLVATDASGAVTQLLTNPTTSTFLGFRSDTGLLSLQVSAIQPGIGNQWATVNNLVVAAPVPEPASMALVLAGLAALAAVPRRRTR